MKKILVYTFLLVFSFGMYVEARTIYDSTGRNIIYNDTIRGRKKASAIEKENKKRLDAAAAAKVNYDEVLKSIENQNRKHPTMKPYDRKY